jgi:hypothetical protein
MSEIRFPLKMAVSWAFALMIGAVGTTVNFCGTTRDNNPEHSELQTRRHEN